MSNAATQSAAFASLTEQDRFVLHHFATAVAQQGGSAGNVGCYTAEQFNRILDAGVLVSVNGRWTLSREGEAVVTAYRNRPDVKRNAARAARAMRRHPST